MSENQDLSVKTAHLNDQQLEMLRLFKNPMEHDDFDEIKRLIVKILARKIDDEMNTLGSLKKWNQSTYDQWGQEHLRSANKK